MKITKRNNVSALQRSYLKMFSGNKRFKWRYCYYRVFDLSLHTHIRTRMYTHRHPHERTRRHPRSRTRTHAHTSTQFDEKMVPLHKIWQKNVSENLSIISFGIRQFYFCRQLPLVIIIITNVCLYDVLADLFLNMNMFSLTMTEATKATSLQHSPNK